MGKIRSILILVLSVGAEDVMHGQGNASLVTPLNQTIATTTWATGGAGNWVVQGTNTKTITFILDPGNQQNLKYRWNVNEDVSRWNIRLLEGGPNGTSRPQNMNGSGQWISTIPLTQRVTVVISAQSTNDPGPTSNRYDGTIEILSASNAILSTARFNGRSERLGSSGGPQQQTQNQQQWQQLQQQQLGSRLQWQGSPTTTLKARFNPKTGKVEVTMNGIISRKGYLNLMGTNLNRRQTLRNYRYR